MTVPPDSVTIRPATDADMEAVAAIYAHHVLYGRASFETEPPSPAEMRRRHAAVAGKGLPYLVAVQAGAGPPGPGPAGAGPTGPGPTGPGPAGAGPAVEVVGYAYAGPYRPRAAYAHTVENSVYLRPDAAGRGIGLCLLSALVAACEQRGLRQMVAVVGDSANEASIRLHEKLGFRRVGVLRDVGYKHGVWLDSVLLQRSLGAGSSTQPCHTDG
jgi:phosphinothricin acetyltransferase